MFWKPELKTEKNNYESKWYKLETPKNHCPNCHVKLRASKKTKKWTLIINFIFVPIWLILILGGWPEGTGEIVKWSFISASIIYVLLSLEYHEYEIDN